MQPRTTEKRSDLQTDPLQTDGREELQGSHDLAGRVLYRLGSLTLTLLTLVKKTGLDRLLQAAIIPIRWTMAALVFLTSLGFREVGRWHHVKGVRSFIPYSTINVTDDTFAPPEDDDDEAVYSPKDFPFAQETKPGPHRELHEWRAHFLSLCVKAAYEEKPIFASITKKDWKPFQFLQMFKTEDPPEDKSKQVGMEVVEAARQTQLLQRMEQSCRTSDPSQNQQQTRQQAERKLRALNSFIPQTRAFVVSNDHAVIVAFRGTEPINLIQWATDASCDMKAKTGVEGRVHEGFHAALFYHSQPDEFQVTKYGMFRRICEFLDEMDSEAPGKALFIAGHSLGGALVSVFANALAKLANDALPFEEWPEGPRIGKSLLARIMKNGGVYTFAGPLAGDEKFRGYLDTNYKSGNYRFKLFRFVHAGDWIPQVPFYFLGYRHHVFEYYMNSLGDLFTRRDAVEFWRGIETSPLTFTALYIYKIVTSPFLHGETFMRTVERILLLFTAPGLTDHWPSDYERCLRQLCFAKNEDGASKMHKNRTTAAVSFDSSIGSMGKGGAINGLSDVAVKGHTSDPLTTANGVTTANGSDAMVSKA